MKGIILCFLLCTSIVMGAVVDRISVIVNDSVITCGEIQGVIQNLKDSQGRLTGFEPYFLLLSNMINEQSVQGLLQQEGFIQEVLIAIKLTTQEAIKSGIEVSDHQVDEVLKEMASKGTSAQQLLIEFHKRGINLKESIKTRLLLDQIRKRKIFPKISISDLELEQFYKLNYKKTPTYKAAYLYIRLTDQDTPEQKKIASDKIIAAEKALKSGTSFSDVVLKYSNGPYKDQGGIMDWMERGALEDQFERQIFDLEKGQYTKSIKTYNGYHLFKLVDRKFKAGKSFKEVRNQIHQRIAYKKWHKVLMSWLDELKRKGYLDYKGKSSNYGRGFSWSKWYSNIKSAG